MGCHLWINLQKRPLHSNTLSTVPATRATPFKNLGAHTPELQNQTHKAPKWFNNHTTRHLGFLLQIYRCLHYFRKHIPHFLQNMFNSSTLATTSTIHGLKQPMLSNIHSQSGNKFKTKHQLMYPLVKIADSYLRRQTWTWLTGLPEMQC